MKHLTSLIASACIILSGCTSPKTAIPKFSTFSDHYITLASQEKISLLEAAQWIKSIGIDGIDAKTTLTSEQMATFIEAGIQPACAILDLSYSRQTPEQMLQAEDDAIRFCKEYGFERLMYCPVLLPQDAPQSMRDSVLQSVKRFSEKAIDSGLDLLFEDYDNPRSLSFNMEALDKIFALIPKANHAYDTGNFFFAGDDPLEAFSRYRKRITHVHLKDRIAVGNSASPAAGTGVVPCLQVVQQLLSEGYKGWFTIEGYGAKNMKEQLSASVENMSAPFKD